MPMPEVRSLQTSRSFWISLITLKSEREKSFYSESRANLEKRLSSCPHTLPSISRSELKIRRRLLNTINCLVELLGAKVSSSFLFRAFFISTFIEQFVLFPCWQKC